MSQTQTLTFKEMVKLIHPDHNPHVQDAGEKMRIAILNKNHPDALYKLAIQWGVYIEPTIEPTSENSHWDTGQPASANAQTVNVNISQGTSAQQTQRPQQRTTTTRRPAHNRNHEYYQYSRATNVRPDPDRYDKAREERRRRSYTWQWEADYKATPQINDYIIITTKNFMRAKVVRTTPKRVYFYYNNKMFMLSVG
jgi:hypothetical protein